MLTSRQATTVSINVVAVVFNTALLLAGSTLWLIPFIMANTFAAVFIFLTATRKAPQPVEIKNTFKPEDCDLFVTRIFEKRLIEEGIETTYSTCDNPECTWCVTYKAEFKRLEEKEQRQKARANVENGSNWATELRRMKEIRETSDVRRKALPNSDHSDWVSEAVRNMAKERMLTAQYHKPGELKSTYDSDFWTYERYRQYSDHGRRDGGCLCDSCRRYHRYHSI